MQFWHWLLIGIYVLIYLISVRWVFRHFMQTGWRMDAGPIAAAFFSAMPLPINVLMFWLLRDYAGPNLLDSDEPDECGQEGVDNESPIANDQQSTRRQSEQ